MNAAADARTRLLPRAVARGLDLVTLVSLGALTLFGLWAAPPDEVQRDAQRIMYLHVPSAWLAYLSFFVTALASVLFLVRRTRSMVWDRLAGASAELGVMFTGLALVLGSLWGKPVWGFWWAWDARLVSTALLFFLFLGYLALRRIPGSDPVAAAKVAVDFAKTNDKFEIVGGSMGATLLNVDGVKALATMPSLDELRAKIVGLIQAPAQKLASITQAPAGQLARVFAAYSEKEAA